MTEVHTLFCIVSTMQYINVIDCDLTSKQFSRDMWESSGQLSSVRQILTPFFAEGPTKNPQSVSLQGERFIPLN